MSRPNNYLIQAQQAKDRFLTYDQEGLIAKLGLAFDDDYLYVPMLGQRYRLARKNGDLERQVGESWADANSFGEVMTLLEGVRDPWAERFEQDPEGFRRACTALKGRALDIGDIAYAIEVFDGLELVLQLWFGDEEFPASLRFLWDENALMYIKYETMYYAKGLLLERIAELM